MHTNLYGGTPPDAENENDTCAQYVDPHGPVAATLRSPGGEIASGDGGGGDGGGAAPPVTVTVKEADGVESPTESWAMQLTVCDPTVNWSPE